MEIIKIILESILCVFIGFIIAMVIFAFKLMQIAKNGYQPEKDNTDINNPPKFE